VGVLTFETVSLGPVGGSGFGAASGQRLSTCGLAVNGVSVSASGEVVSFVSEDESSRGLSSLSLSSLVGGLAVFTWSSVGTIAEWDLGLSLVESLNDGLGSLVSSGSSAVVAGLFSRSSSASWLFAMRLGVVGRCWLVFISRDRVFLHETDWLGCLHSGSSSAVVSWFLTGGTSACGLLSVRMGRVHWSWLFLLGVFLSVDTSWRVWVDTVSAWCSIRSVLLAERNVSGDVILWVL